MDRTLRRSAAALLSLSLVLAACSGSSSDGAGGSGGAADETTTTTAATVDAAPVGEVATGEPVPSAGCGTTEVRSVRNEKTYVDDSDRWFLLTTPLAHDGTDPLPLVLDFHGLAEGADIHSAMSDLATTADEEGFIVAGPNGTGTPIRWDLNLDVDANPDLQYTIDLLDQLEANLCVDTSRIYSTGLSMGAMFSSVLGCSLSDRIVAIAPVAGVLRPESCDPERPVPVVAFHGTDDQILLFEGGIGEQLGEVVDLPDDIEAAESETPAAISTSFADNAGAWAEANGCDPDPVDEEVSDTALNQVWECPANGATEFYVLDGGGHSWPGSAASKGLESVIGPTDDLDANAVIWAFFQRFQLPDA